MKKTKEQHNERKKEIMEKCCEAIEIIVEFAAKGSCKSIKLETASVADQSAFYV